MNEGPPDTGDDDVTGPSPGARIGPFEVEGPLGRGGMAHVLVVRDTRDGRRAAMKLMRPVQDDESVRSRFRREFRALSRLHHPNVLRVEEWGIDHGRPWFTMELVDGVDLREAIGRWARLDSDDRFTRVHSTLVQVARALAYVHERGLVHRDVSPGNVMIRSDGSVKLTDFGLVTGRDAELTTAGEILGTVAHIAPEQLRGQPVDARADLYALGTVLYQMLTGRKPFQAHTVQGWVDKHLHEVPRPPSEADPLVPELLDRVCQRLLEKEPRDRFASAMHLLHVLGDQDPVVDAERFPPRDVGRTAVKAWIREVAEEAAAGRQGAALLLTGGAGSGKTRMLELLDREARRRGLRVARGRCRLHDRPFGPFATIFDALAGEDPPEVLLHAFRGGSDDRAERYPVISAFRDLVVQAAPCVILLDQIERADAATRELAEFLVRNTLELADLPVVFGFVAEGPADPELLRSVEAVHHEHLGPLAPSEVEELVLSVLPDDEGSDALARRLHEETGGSPAYIADMLHGLVDEGVLEERSGRWRLTLAPEDISHSRLPLPDSLRDVLVERLEPLSPDARAVGGVLAVVRGSLDLDVLVEAAELSEDAVMDALDELEAADIVVESRRGDEDYVELSHARFRDVLLEGLPSAELRARHLRVGELLERRHRYRLADVAEALAWHFEQAGVPGKAYTYLAQIGFKMSKRSLFDQALVNLDRALRIEPQARAQLTLDDADRRLVEVRLARARALYHLGRWDESFADASRADELATALRDDARISRAENRLGHIRRNQNQLAAAERHLRRALHHAELAQDRALLPTPLYHLGALAWARGDLDDAAASWSRGMELARETGNRRAEGLAHNGVGIIHICRGEAKEARRELEVAADMFGELGMVGYLSIARVNLIELYIAVGMLRRAIQLTERTLAQARELAHPHGISMGLVWRARLLLVLGQPEEARRTAAEAQRLAKELGTPEEEVSALTTLVEAMLRMDMASFAPPRLDAVRELLAEADHEGLGAQVAALEVLMLADLDQEDRAHETLDAVAVEARFPHVEVRTLIDLGRASTRLGRLEEAEDRLSRALEVARTHGYRFFELLAVDGLARAAADTDDRERHARAAQSLARNLAASLPRDRATTFLARGWGLGTARP